MRKKNSQTEKESLTKNTVFFRDESNFAKAAKKGLQLHICAGQFFTCGKLNLGSHKTINFRKNLFEALKKAKLFKIAHKKKRIPMNKTIDSFKMRFLFMKERK